jgi:arylsulfatase A-like enzyme
MPNKSCTSGRNAFFTGMHPVRTGMVPPQLPGSPSYLRPATPALAVFLHDLGYNTGEFGKNHLGDHAAALPNGARLPGAEAFVCDGNSVGWLPVPLVRYCSAAGASGPDG